RTGRIVGWHCSSSAKACWGQTNGKRYIRIASNQLMPYTKTDLLRPLHDVRLVHREDLPLAHQPLSVHHHRLDVGGLAIVDKGRYDAKRRHEIGPSGVDEEEIGLLA